LNDGAGNFSAPHLFGPGSGGAASVAVGDVDGDRDLDIVVGGTGQSMIYLNDGAGNFAVGDTDCAAPPATARCFGRPNPDARSVALGDFNGDQRQDIVAGNHVYLNDGRGNFAAGQIACGITLGVDCLDTPVAGVAVADMNGDGRPDIIAGNA